MPLKKYVTQAATAGSTRLILTGPGAAFGFTEIQGKKVVKGTPATVTDISAMNPYDFVGYAHENILVGYNSSGTIVTFDTSGTTPVLVATKAAASFVSGYSQRKGTKMMKHHGGRSPLMCQHNLSLPSVGHTVVINSDGTIAATWDRGPDLPGFNVGANRSTSGAGDQSNILHDDGQCAYISFDNTLSQWTPHQLQMTDTGYDYHGPLTLPGSEALNNLIHVPYVGKDSGLVMFGRNNGAAENQANLVSGGLYFALYDVGPVPGGTSATALTELDRWTPPATDPIKGWASQNVYGGELSGGKFAALLTSSAVVDGNSRTQFTWYNDIFGTPEVGSVAPANGADNNQFRSVITNWFGNGHAGWSGSYRGTFSSDRWFYHWTKGKIGRLRVYDGSTWRKA